MESKKRLFVLDGDQLEVTFSYDHQAGRYFGDYPDFSLSPRFTPSGRPWVNVLRENCPLGASEMGDCGSCPHFCTEQQNDLIGICLHEENLLQVK